MGVFRHLKLISTSAQSWHLTLTVLPGADLLLLLHNYLLVSSRRTQDSENNQRLRLIINPLPAVPLPPPQLNDTTQVNCD